MRITNAKISGTFLTYSLFNPSELALTGISNTEIYLSWVINSFVQTGHYIYMSSDSGVTYSIKGTVIGDIANYTVSGLSAGTNYFFKVCAFKEKQLSAFSNVAIGTTASPLLILEVTTSSPSTLITIPHIDGYVYDYYVNYGDGSSINHVISYNDTGCTHVYASANIYDIQITGTCETIYCNGSGDLISYLTKILSWGSVGLKVINFWQCQYLNSIPADIYGGLSQVTDFTNAFANCYALTSIPSGLFNYCTKTTNFNYTFSTCNALVSIPTGLFDHNPLVTNFNSTFAYCEQLTAIPAHLFDYCTGVTSFNNTFNSCLPVTTIPTGLFDHNPLVTDFTDTFDGDDGPMAITSIPAGLFDHNPLVTSFQNTFNSCTKITSIPAGLFDHNPLVTSFQNTFNSCT